MSGIELAIMSATATLLEGYSQKKQADYNAGVQREQARAYENASYRKRLETAINEDAQRRENRQALARQIASANEQGMGNSQTTIGALGQYARDNEQNALNIRYEGQAQAEQLTNQANAYNWIAKYTKKQGKNAWNDALIKAPLSFASGYMMSGQDLDKIGTMMAGINDIWDYTKNPTQEGLKGISSKYKGKWTFGG